MNKPSNVSLCEDGELLSVERYTRRGKLGINRRPREWLVFIAEANGWFSGNPSFGKSLLEYSEETRKGKRDTGTVAISVEELQKLRAEAAKAR